MTFQDIFKSSFLEKASEYSLIDIGLAMLLSFALGLFIFMGSMNGGREGMGHRSEMTANQGVATAVEAGNFKPEQDALAKRDGATAWSQEEREEVPWHLLGVCVSVLLLGTGLALGWKRTY